MRRPTPLRLLLPAGVLLTVAACGALPNREPPRVTPKEATEDAKVDAPPWQQDDDEALLEAREKQQQPVLVRGGRVLLGDGRELAKGYVLLKEGRIAAVGEGDGPAEAGARVIDASGKVVTPGLIDTHSHLGVYPSPRADAHRDGNEATDPVTAEVRAIDAIWAQDPGFERALAGGVTSLQILPGSANLVGGRAVTIKLRRARTAQGLRMQGAPPGLKIACGENPKRVYGERKQAPSTRMGNLAGQRAAFLQAKRLIDEWAEWRREEAERVKKESKARAKIEAEREQRKQRAAWCEDARGRRKQERCAAWQAEWQDDPLEDPEPEPPKLPPARDLALETLAGALEGRVLVHVHCYRADDMSRMLALADEVGLKIRSFHHALEAYKIRKELARRSIGVSTWADWWGFKLEAYDGIPENIALVEMAGGKPIVHSDSAEGIQRLNQEAGKALWSGLHAGIKVPRERAITWLTQNPAWALGIDHRVGVLKTGYDADVVIWSGDPFSVYTRAEHVFVDGIERWNASQSVAPESDFEVMP